VVRIEDLAVVPDGDVIVLATGETMVSVNDVVLTRLGRRDGAPRWRARIQEHDLVGGHLAIDRRGDLAITAADAPSPSDSLLRVYKREGRSGID
jgi:hypothetical protein